MVLKIRGDVEQQVLSFKFIFKWTLYDFFLAELPHFDRQETLFQFSHPIPRVPNNLGGKKKLKQKDATFMYNPRNLRICTFTFFFKFSIS